MVGCVWFFVQGDNGRGEASQARAVVTIGKPWQDVLDGLSALPRTTLTCHELTPEREAPCTVASVTSHGTGWLSSGYFFRVKFVEGRVTSATEPEYTEW